MAGMIILGLAAIIGCIGYLIFFIHRIFVELIGLTMNIPLWILIIVIAVLLSLPAVNMFSTYAVGYFYFIGASVVLEIVIHFLHPGMVKNIFTSGVVALVAVALFISWGYYNMNHVVETDFAVQSKKNNQIRILAISDLHMGMNIDPTKLENIVDKINKGKTPDLVVLDGDIFDENTGKDNMVKASKILSGLHNKYGIYYVYGNHDDNKYARNGAHFNKEDIRNELTKNKIVVLDDEIKNIDHNITLVGRRDASFNRKTSKQLLSQVNKKNYIIVLDHQPEDIEENAKNGADLQISGHTHGGQIWPTGYLQAIMTHTMRYGVKKEGRMTAVTTSGIAGWGYPIKTGAPSEYAIIKVNE